MHQSFPPMTTPNVVIESPKVRKVIRLTLDLSLLATLAIAAGDSFTEAIDATPYTLPALAVLAVFRAGFGIGVDNPNTPTTGGAP